MKVLSVLWNVLLNIATTIIILAMFHVANGAFETIVVSALVLIYVSIATRFTGLATMLMAMSNQSYRRYVNLANALRMDTEIDREALKENEEEARGGLLGIWIDLVFNSIFYVIAIWKLIVAVA